MIEIVNDDGLLRLAPTILSSLVRLLEVLRYSAMFVEFGRVGTADHNAIAALRSNQER